MANPVEAWTGASASRLQAALRLSTEDFARRLGVAARTVANWHAQPERVPRPEMQQLLDTILEGASAGARARFDTSMSAETAPPTSGLHVAIAVVTRGPNVLLVQRRDGGGLTWQFPAGIVKPESSAPRVVVEETKLKTGVDCSVTRSLGSRVHPGTGVYCAYYLCDYLAGDATNCDIVENSSVAWAEASDLAKFIPLGSVFPPVLHILGVGE